MKVRNLVIGVTALMLSLFANFAPIVPNNVNYITFSGSNKRCEVRDERKLSPTTYLKQLLQRKVNPDPYERVVEVVGYSDNESWKGVGYEISNNMILTVAHAVGEKDARYVIKHPLRGETHAVPVSVDGEKDLALLVTDKEGSFKTIPENYSTRIKKGKLTHGENVKGIKMEMVGSGGYFTSFRREKEELLEDDRYVNRKRWPINRFDRFTREEELDVGIIRENTGGVKIEYGNGVKVKNENPKTIPGFSGSPIFDNENNLAGMIVAIENVKSGSGVSINEKGEVKITRFSGYDIATSNTSIRNFLETYCEKKN